MNTFECKTCNKLFEAEGKRKEWNDPVFGACWNTISQCPDCQSECSEYREPSRKRNANCSSGSCSTCNCSCCG